MGVVAVLAGVALAAVFIVSGVAKLLDLAGTRQAVAGFGVPERLVPVVAAALPPVEIAVALLVLLPATATVGFVAALLLLAAFTAAVGWALRTGRRPDCHCFGRLGGADVSARTVVRNGVLLAVAAVGLAAAGAARPDGVPLVAAVGAGLALAAAIIAAETLAGRAARRRRATADEAAFTAGSAASDGNLADFTLPTLSGRETSLREMLAPGRPALLVTLSPGCGPCKKIRPDVAHWAQVLKDRVTVAVVAVGGSETNEPYYADATHLTVLLDEAGEVRRSLGTTAAPSAVLVGPDGRLASGVASGEPLVRRLLVQALTGTEIQDEPETDGVPAADLGPASRVARRDTVESHDMGSGSFVLLDTSSGATVMVDALGSLIWSVLDGSPLDEVVDDLAEAFEAPRERVAADVLTLVRSLGEAGLLAGVVPTTGRVDLEHAHGVA